jgi:hypothetical protein
MDPSTLFLLSEGRRAPRLVDTTMDTEPSGS